MVFFFCEKNNLFEKEKKGRKKGVRKIKRIGGGRGNEAVFILLVLSLCLQKQTSCPSLGSRLCGFFRGALKHRQKCTHAPFSKSGFNVADPVCDIHIGL
jgi:hypothetical protein